MSPLAAAFETTFPGEVELRFPFSGDMVDALKEAIPARHRRWVPEEKVWRVDGPYATTAITLLVERHPDAKIPSAYAHLAPKRVVTEARPPQRAPRKTGTPAAPDDLLATVPCPRCHERYDVPIRVTVETATGAAKHAITPEFISVCPACNTLLVIGFVPTRAKTPQAS